MRPLPAHSATKTTVLVSCSFLEPRESLLHAFAKTLCLGKRRRADLNRCTRLCRPLPNLSATAPRATIVAPRFRRTRIGYGYSVPRQLSFEETAAPDVPTRPSLTGLREAAASCTACDLYKTGTQTVFGEGAPSAETMFVGEQPGDQEDRIGRPFVGPAGRLFDEALAEAGIDRGTIYVTNVVKHFKWIARGKRRIHQKPDAREVAACRPWLDAELQVVQPRVLVCLGATAAQALLGRQFRVTRERGSPVDSELAEHVLATVHPSSILRGDPADREREYAAFVNDLKVGARLL
jgi:uracil-DNA glycosylase family protein